MNVFAYGSLMIPSVMHAVTGRWFTHTEAVLEGYARYGIDGESYPGIVPQEGAEIHCGEAAVSSATGRREPERSFARSAGASRDPPPRSGG